jgi:ribosomal protein S18 acetylase RimI-like enzyme
MALKFEPVKTDAQIVELSQLARDIWFGYWPDIIGREQTEYMVEKFQSEPAIRRDMTENAYEYWFLVEDAIDAEGGVEGASANDTSASAGNADTVSSSEGATFTPSAYGNIMGFTGGHVDEATGRFFISKIYLLPEARGRGYCSRVIEFYTELCLERGLSAMYLTVNKNNKLGLRAYRGNGFYVAEEVVLEIGDGFVMDDYIMQKDVIAIAKGA